MSKRATEGTLLDELIDMAIKTCRAAQEHCPRTGPGRPPDFVDWKIAVLIMVAVLKKRKSKSSQYRFLDEHQSLLMNRLELPRWPVRSTYFDRYARAVPFFEAAVKLQGRAALRAGITSASSVAGDKSLVAARGPAWHRSQKRRGETPRGVDRQAAWGKSPHHGWVFGYSYEVVVTATAGWPVVPLLASASVASASEHKTFGSKIAGLPRGVCYALLDGGYDNNGFAERVEFDRRGRRTGRRYLCPPQPRAHEARPGLLKQRGRRERTRLRRVARFAFYKSPRGRRLFAQRGKTVEPFHEWFKRLFDLEGHAWHRGLGNNQTQLLAAIGCYQLLIRYNHRHRRKPVGEIQGILDAL